MKIKFKMTRKHYINMIEAIQFTEAVYIGNFTPIITILRRDTLDGKPFIIQDDEVVAKAIEGFKSMAFPLFNKINSEEEIINPNIQYIKNLLLKLKPESINSQKSMMVLEVEMSKGEIKALKTALNFVSRLYICQIEEVFSLLFDNEISSGKRFYNYLYATNEAYSCIHQFLSKIIDKDVCLRNNLHFGIYNNDVNNKARILYDLYKVLMYESGEKGVYGFQPCITCGIVLPEIEFPQTKIKLNHINDIYTIVDESDLHVIDGDLYLNIEKKYTSIKIEEGDIIYKKYNGKYMV